MACRASEAAGMVEDLLAECSRWAPTEALMRGYYGRADVVDWVLGCAPGLALSQRTAHLAVLLVDLVQLELQLPSFELQPLAKSCLVLAAKYEEVETAVPKYRALATAGMPPVRDLGDMELVALKALRWRVGRPTAAHALEIFLNAGWALEGPASGDVSGFWQARQQLDETCKLFLNMALLSPDIWALQPHNVAAACIGAARWFLGKQPVWSPVLKESLAGPYLCHSQMEECFGLLRATYLRRFPAVTPLPCAMPPPPMPYAPRDCFVNWPQPRQQGPQQFRAQPGCAGPAVGVAPFASHHEKACSATTSLLFIEEEKGGY